MMTVEQKFRVFSIANLGCYLDICDLQGLLCCSKIARFLKCSLHEVFVSKVRSLTSFCHLLENYDVKRLTLQGLDVTSFLSSKFTFCRRLTDLILENVEFSHLQTSSSLSSLDLISESSSSSYPCLVSLTLKNVNTPPEFLTSFICSFESRLEKLSLDNILCLKDSHLGIILARLSNLRHLRICSCFFVCVPSLVDCRSLLKLEVIQCPRLSNLILSPSREYISLSSLEIPPEELCFKYLMECDVSFSNISTLQVEELIICSKQLKYLSANYCSNVSGDLFIASNHLEKLELGCCRKLSGIHIIAPLLCSIDTRQCECLYAFEIFSRELHEINLSHTRELVYLRLFCPTLISFNVCGCHNLGRKSWWHTSIRDDSKPGIESENSSRSSRMRLRFSSMCETIPRFSDVLVCPQMNYSLISSHQSHQRSHSCSSLYSEYSAYSSYMQRNEVSRANLGKEPTVLPIGLSRTHSFDDVISPTRYRVPHHVDNKSVETNSTVAIDSFVSESDDSEIETYKSEVMPKTCSFLSSSQSVEKTSLPATVLLQNLIIDCPELLRTCLSDRKSADNCLRGSNLIDTFVQEYLIDVRKANKETKAFQKQKERLTRKGAFFQCETDSDDDKDREGINRATPSFIDDKKNVIDRCRNGDIVTFASCTSENKKIFRHEVDVVERRFGCSITVDTFVESPRRRSKKQEDCKDGTFTRELSRVRSLRTKLKRRDSL